VNDSFRLGSDGIYRCDAFQQFVWQKHGFGTRLGSPGADITLRQVHSNRVYNAHGLKDREREGDALITDDVGKSIGIRTADCVPILLLDSRTRAVAAVHAGWRGTLSHIVRQTIEKMNSEFGTEPGDVHAAMGPCIRDCCYEVGKDLAEQFASYFPDWDPKATKHLLDLPKANHLQMEAAGVPGAHIYDIRLCTTCETGQFFSYRREPENPGRMVAAVCRLA
jgi:YfiH family protein